MPRILNFEAFKGMGARRHQLNHPTETSFPIQPKAEFSKVKTPWQMQQGTWGYHLLKQAKREGPIQCGRIWGKHRSPEFLRIISNGEGISSMKM